MTPSQPRTLNEAMAALSRLPEGHPRRMLAGQAHRCFAFNRKNPDPGHREWAASAHRWTVWRIARGELDWQ